MCYINDTVGYLLDNKYNCNIENYSNFVSIYNKKFIGHHGEIIKTTMNQDILKIEL